MGDTFSIALSVILVVLSLVYARIRTNIKGKYPPGPKGLPILGNVLQVPGQVSTLRHPPSS